MTFSIRKITARLLTVTTCFYHVFAPRNLPSQAQIWFSGHAGVKLISFRVKALCSTRKYVGKCSTQLKFLIPKQNITKTVCSQTEPLKIKIKLNLCSDKCSSNSTCLCLLSVHKKFIYDTLLYIIKKLRSTEINVTQMCSQHK